MSAETAQKNKKIPRADSTLKEHHLDKNTFDEHGLEFKAPNLRAKCKFTKRLKYDIQLTKPDAFDLGWVYSVPAVNLSKWARASPGSS